MEIVTIVCLILIVQSSSVYADVDHKAEAQALLDFKRPLADPLNKLANWDASSTNAPCNWFRIGCDSQGYVSAIYLGGVGVGGLINGTALTKLPRLVHLDLSSNNIRGSIPEAFQNIRFTRLVLNNNQINGTIPCSLGRKYEISYTLQLQNNKLEGCVPGHLWKPNQNYFKGNPNLNGRCATCRPKQFVKGHCCP